MQGVLDRFLPTLFFVITTAAGHKTQSSVHDALSVIFIPACHESSGRISLLK